MIVLRHGETFLKGANRRSFEQVLERNVRAAVRDLGEVRLHWAQGRFFVHLPASHTGEAVRRLREVFGLSSVSPAIEIPTDPERLVAAASAATKQLLDDRRPASFKVQTRRSEKRFPLTSPEISTRLGAAIATELDLPVDIHEPELVVGVEVGVTASFVFVDKLPGAGGLPVGSGGRVVLLLSGGIDSPVAGHLAQKRGCQLHALYFHSPPHTSERARDKVERLAQRLAQQQESLTLHVIRFTEIQQRIRERAPAELLVVLYRRAMMRIAEQVAREHRCAGIVTGESLGQVASQTIENLQAIGQVTDLPILRPLIAYDKQETITLARRLQTYEISIEPHIDCCSLFVPRHPATRVRPQRAESAEVPLELDPLLQQAVTEAQKIVLKAEYSA